METLTVTICRSHGIFWRAPLLPSRDEYSQRSNSRQSRDQVQEPMAGLWAITLGIHRSPFQLSTPLAKRAVARGFQWFCGRASGQRLSATAASVKLDSRLLSYARLGKLLHRCEACPHLPTPFPLIFSLSALKIWTFSALGGAAL